MKIKMKKSMFIIPLTLTLMIPNTTPIFADEIQEQTQEQTNNLVQEEATATETMEENTQYVATFYDEDGTLLDSISKESSDSSITINPTKLPTKEGYTFIGWSKTQGSTTTDFNKEEVTVDQSNPEVKFYAVYQENPKEEMKTYTVHFLDENGNEMEAVTKESEDTSISIYPTTTPSKENYTFIGWASEQHSAKADLGKDGITVDASNPEISVYAVYTLNFKATVRFCDEDGKVIETKSVMRDDIHTDQVTTRKVRPSQTPSKKDCEFLGWSMTKGSKTAEFDQGYVEVNQENPKVTVYAVYKEKETKYTVHFLNENGTEIESITKESEDPSIVIQATKTPSKENYTFIGWASEQHSAKADLGKDGITVDASNPDISVYAVYTLNFKATVRFCDEDGKEIETKSVMRDDIHTDQVTTRKVRPSQTPSKEGYEFIGWSTTKGSKTAEFDQGYVEVNQENPKVTVYAVYKEKGTKYTVHFMDEDGKEIETQTKIIDDQEQNETNSNEENQEKAVRISPSKEPSKEGYQFLGWSTQQQATTAEYDKGYVEVKDDNRDVTVYAVYKAQLMKYTVHFCDENGKEIETVSKEETQQNWYIKQNKDKIPFTSFTYINQNNLPDFIKKAIEKRRDNIIDEASKMVISPSKNPSKKGYIFLGWAKEKDSKNVDYDRKNGVTVDDKNPEITVYAVYKEDEKMTYSITYYNNTEMYQNYFKERKFTPRVLEKMSYTKDTMEGKLDKGLNVKLSRVVFKDRCYFVKCLRSEFDRKEFTYAKYHGNLHKLFAPKRINFAFCGWTTDPNGTEPEYKPGEKIKVTKDNPNIKLYAVYKPRSRNLSAEATAKDVDESVKVIATILEIIIVLV